MLRENEGSTHVAAAMHPSSAAPRDLLMTSKVNEVASVVSIQKEQGVLRISVWMDPELISDEIKRINQYWRLDSWYPGISMSSYARGI